VSIKAINELVQMVEEANSSHSQNPYETSYFRSVEHKLEECFFSLPPEETKPEMLSVYLLLEHILTILTGDVRYHAESIKLVQKVFANIGNLLAELVKLLEGNHQEDTFGQVYSETVKNYLINVRLINELLKKKA